MSYGSYFKMRRTGIWIMINGRMFSFFKSEHTGKWKFSVWDNVWRKNGIQH